MSALDVLAVLERHAESHEAMAVSDSYSAQEAPRLRAAIAAVRELYDEDRLRDHKAECFDALVEALEAVKPMSDMADADNRLISDELNQLFKILEQKADAALAAARAKP